MQLRGNEQRKATDTTLRISGLIRLGPRDEKEAMAGAGFTPRTVVTGEMVAVGDLSKKIEFSGQK